MTHYIKAEHQMGVLIKKFYTPANSVMCRGISRCLFCRNFF